MVLSGTRHRDRIVRTPPLLIVEVLSPEDTRLRLLEKVNDYLRMGVEHIWAFDPNTRLAFRCDATDIHEVTDEELTIPGTSIRLKLADVFAALDR